MTTRNEQKEQRRQLIIMSALEIFAKKGYKETKVSDIAKAAGMSTGLMFHYFESKEQLYEELVRMGVEGTNTPQTFDFKSPEDFFKGFLDMMFDFAKQQPWVFYMFVLMSQTRRSDGIPTHIKEIAMSANQIEQSAEIIRLGQSMGIFKDGDPYALSSAFWCSVQGIMEQYAVMPEMPLPESDWLVDILRR